MITQEKLKELLHYDPDTGVFTWRVKTSYRVEIGQIAGTLRHGYIGISIKRKKYFAHRLAWLYVYGNFPDKDVDHINQVKSDNRISNLRLATRRQNCFNKGKNKNNTSGYKGVYFDKRLSRWTAGIFIDGKRRHLGVFDDPKKASDAYQLAAKEYVGEFAG